VFAIDQLQGYIAKESNQLIPVALHTGDELRIACLLVGLPIEFDGTREPQRPLALVENVKHLLFEGREEVFRLGRVVAGFVASRVLGQLWFNDEVQEMLDFVVALRNLLRSLGCMRREQGFIGL
jgi:hypothetical protein